MIATIEPGTVSGTIAAPPSKSHTQRIYAAALLHQGTTYVHGAGHSDDELAAFSIIQQLGARIEQLPGGVVAVSSNGIQPISGEINCVESGLSTRLFAPIAALSSQPITIHGKGSLLKRPMHDFNEILPALGVALPGFNGFVPFTLQGPLVPRNITIDAGESSQFLSGLLFALASVAKETITVSVKALTSKPYIDLSLAVLAHFGRPVYHNRYREFIIDPALFTHQQTVEVAVEGDWSSAAYLLTAGAIAGNVKVQHLNLASTQADRAILKVLQLAGADILIDDTDITVKKSELQAFEFDATHCPDLFPVLAVLGACASGDSYVRGVHRLFHKESNRVESVTEMLESFGVHFSVEDDTLCINGETRLQGTVVDSYHDHRIVMAAAIGALRAGSRVDILHAEAVSKSYPEFFTDLAACGVKCMLAND
jgi:3-phosphoshikimate 1-carboxyvinyltransferase